jgi:hypothetical protein
VPVLQLDHLIVFLPEPAPGHRRQRTVSSAISWWWATISAGVSGPPRRGRDQHVHPAVQHRRQQDLLGREVVVEDRRAGPGRGRDVAHRRAVVAVQGHDLDRGRDEPRGGGLVVRAHQRRAGRLAGRRAPPGQPT